MADSLPGKDLKIVPHNEVMLRALKQVIDPAKSPNLVRLDQEKGFSLDWLAYLSGELYDPLREFDTPQAGLEADKGRLLWMPWENSTIEGRQRTDPSEGYLINETQKGGDGEVLKERTLFINSQGRVTHVKAWDRLHATEISGFFRRGEMGQLTEVLYETRIENFPQNFYFDIRGHDGKIRSGFYTLGPKVGKFRNFIVNRVPNEGETSVTCKEDIVVGFDSEGGKADQKIEIYFTNRDGKREEDFTANSVVGKGGKVIKAQIKPSKAPVINFLAESVEQAA